MTSEYLMLIEFFTSLQKRVTYKAYYICITEMSLNMLQQNYIYIKILRYYLPERLKQI